MRQGNVSRTICLDWHDRHDINLSNTEKKEFDSHDTFVLETEILRRKKYGSCDALNLREMMR